MEELEQRTAGTFAFDPDRGIVSLVWADASLDEDEVKEMLVRFGEHAKTHPCSALLVDAREFDFLWSPAMDAWRDASVVPDYNDAGVRKFAFVFRDVVPLRPPAKMPPANFETGGFHTIKDAETWIAAG
jgi:hypothetical protein